MEEQKTRGKLTLAVLEAMADIAVGTADLLGAFLNAGYGASYGKVQRELSRVERIRWRETAERNAKQRYYNLMYALKRDGLIEERGKNGEKKWFTLTKAGAKKLLALRTRQKVSIPRKTYIPEKSDTFVIVAFDVPEQERRKRNWLRESLKNIGLTMIQKSVWIGKIKIPETFLEDLWKLKLADFVEIFEVSKAGSLRRLT